MRAEVGGLTADEYEAWLGGYYRAMLLARADAGRNQSGSAGGDEGADRSSEFASTGRSHFSRFMYS